MNRRFISFEGIDFSGKSTQIALLKDYIEQNGVPVYVLREPGGTEISEAIRTILLDHRHGKMTARSEFLLFSAARAQLVEEKIRPLLQDGSFVIADRFVDSSTAYQGAGRGLEQAMVGNVNRFATGGLMPSVTFYMRLSVDAAAKRRRALNKEGDRMETAGQAFFKRVIDGYDALARQEPQRIEIIDAMQSIEKIQQSIQKRINGLL